MVFLVRSPGCESRHEPAWSQGYPIPADNSLNEPTRVCTVILWKSPPWHGLDAAFASHFVLVPRFRAQPGASVCCQGGVACYQLRLGVAQLESRLTRIQSPLSGSVGKVLRSTKNGQWQH